MVLYAAACLYTFSCTHLLVKGAHLFSMLCLLACWSRCACVALVAQPLTSISPLLLLLLPQVGAETFRLCRELCDGVLLVDNAAISAAIKDVFNETRSILEPAGAVAVAGAKSWLKENGHQVMSTHCLRGCLHVRLVANHLQQIKASKYAEWQQ
jgi:hypothetical protein